MKELVAKINAEYEVFAANAAAQVEKGNKAAGTRARKSALEISKLMKEFPQGFRRGCEIIADYKDATKAVLAGSLCCFRAACGVLPRASRAGTGAGQGSMPNLRNTSMSSPARPVLRKGTASLWSFR